MIHLLYGSTSTVHDLIQEVLKNGHNQKLLLEYLWYNCIH